jgi:hypothetical protein
MTAEPRDSVTSIAQFSDVATSQSLKSAARNLSIGTLKQQDPTELNEPIIFEWDPSFFSTYLPINAEASLVISSPGWDDKINAHITESLKVMISGGALAENWLFHDDLNAHFTEMALTTISSKYADPMTIQLQDGPFSGFLPGFANVPYDDDDGYDTGQPPDLYSLLSKANLTAQEEQDVLDRWDNFLLDNAIPTTEAQWAFVYAALTSDPNPGTVTDDTGFPALGLGFDISAASTGTTATAIKETAVIVAHDQSSAHDLYSYGTGEIDTLDESTGFIYAAALPPLPVSVPPGATYETLDTPLYVLSPARVFEVSFNASAGALAALNPVFSIWLPGAAAPVRVSVVEKIALGRYRFSIPSPSEAKILVT